MSKNPKQVASSDPAKPNHSVRLGVVVFNAVTPLPWTDDSHEFPVWPIGVEKGGKVYFGTRSTAGAGFPAQFVWEIPGVAV